MATLQVKKYNPLEMSNDDILALATGREKLLDIMLAEMKVCLKPGSNQHFVLHGPRGIGKSFFTKLLKIHHDRSTDFVNSLYIQLPEEQENINFASDLLDVIATLLEGGRLVDSAPRWTISDAQWQRSKQRLRDAIAKIKESGKNHVFVTQENLQAFIPKLDKIESARLREFLSDFDEVTIIGSSLRPDLDNDYTKRLFQVFKKLDIAPWTADDFLTYYDKLAMLSKYDKEQLENLKKSKNKIRAISQFTGGSPRLAVIMSKLILEKNMLETAQLLDGIIDELTTYYQDITNDIPAKSKILFDMLIRKGENMTQSNLAAAFEPPLEQKDIARSFAWLIDNYYVINSKQSRGNTKYFYVRDRLYVLYYQKRQVYADVPFSFIGVFVDFLNVFYSQKEKMQELTCIDINHPYALPMLSTFAQKEGLSIDASTLNPIIIRDRLILKYNEPAISKLKSSKANKARKIVTAFEDGNAYYEKGEFDKAIIAYEKAIELNPEYVEAYNNLGAIYSDKGEFKKAVTKYEQTIRINPKYDDEYNNIGNVYLANGNIESAILYYEKTIRLNPKHALAYYNLGLISVQLGDIEKAIRLYEKSLELDPEFGAALNNLGIIYCKKGEYVKAISLFKKALKFKNKFPQVYNNLGIVYYLMQEYDKSIIYYLEAIKQASIDANTFYNIGFAYFKKSEYLHSLKSISRALELQPNEVDFLGFGLAVLINDNLWNYLNQFHDQWKGDKPFSSILGESLHKVIKQHPDNKFYHFKNTIDAIRNLSFININEVINGLCLGLYKEGDMDFLRQVVDELSQDFADDDFVKINLDVYQYLLNPDGNDINQLHPDVRTVVESILNDK